MMKKAFVVLFMAVIALSFCSKKVEDKKAPLAERSFHEANEPRPAPAAGAESPLWITAVRLSPEAPTVLDDITAAAELSDPALENVSFQYEWHADGRELADVWGDKVEKGKLKRGSWVYCRMKAVRENAESEWAKSDLIQVLNTPPTLQLGPVGEISVPGDFRYRAAAGDPDGDNLTFELPSPPDPGIAIDAKSGLLTWSLTEEIVKRLGGKAEIKIVVNDGEAKAEGTITLQFISATKKTEIP